MPTIEGIQQEHDEILSQREALGVSPQMTKRAFDYYANGVNHQSYSSDNPYYQQMAWAKNLDDLKRLQTAAIEWESNRQALEDQRAYDDPAAQAARRRAAGQNPDLDGGQGVSAGSSAEQAPVDLDTLSTSTEQANTVFNGISLASSAIGAVTGALNAGLQFVEGVSTLGDALQISSSTAQAAQSAANVATATEQSAISEASSSAEAAAAGAESVKLANSTARLGLLGDVASQIPADATVDEAYALKHLQSLGVGDAAELAPLLVEYVKSPQQQAFYDQHILSARRAKAEKDAASFDLVSGIISAGYESQFYSARSSALTARFEYSVAQAFNTEENAAATATVLGDSLSADVSTAKLRREQAKRDFDAFLAGIDDLKRQEEIISADIASYDGKKLSPPRQAYINKQRVRLLNIRALGSQDLARLGQIMDGYYSSAFLYDIMQAVNPQVREQSGGDLVLGQQTVRPHYFDFHNMLFENYNADTKADISTKFVELLKLVK